MRQPTVPNFHPVLKYNDSRDYFQERERESKFHSNKNPISHNQIYQSFELDGNDDCMCNFVYFFKMLKKEENGKNKSLLINDGLSKAQNLVR